MAEKGHTGVLRVGVAGTREWDLESEVGGVGSMIWVGSSSESVSSPCGALVSELQS